VHDRNALVTPGALNRDESQSGDVAATDAAARREQGLLESLILPFCEEDLEASGSLDLKTFGAAMRGIGGMLTLNEISIVAKKYRESDDGKMGSSGMGSMARWDDSENAAKSMRDRQMTGTLRGAARAEGGAFGEWLTGQGIGLEENFKVNYTSFVKDLVKVIGAMEESHRSFGERSNERRKGIESRVGSNSWMLKDFDVVDMLITQLEEMKPGPRRRVLMSLQYALTSADANQEGDLDGFSVLKALLGAGFKMHRIGRVRLLRSIEEMGGKMKYADLCQVLMRSSADWSSDERSVVGKILKAMGVGVLERRAWLSRLRQDLMKLDSDSSKGRSASARAGRKPRSDPNAGGVPPAGFLQCLRDAAVSLSVEEEATLLDCLDTERQAEMTGKDGSGPTGVSDSWAVPLIHYKSFVNFCARHCGHWTDAAPDLSAAITDAISGLDDTQLGLHEFGALLNSFDEVGTGTVGSRAFQICCHRSRLLSNLSEEKTTELADVLLREGGGRIDYTPFLVHLRALMAHADVDDSADDILQQLIKNATDGHGTLLPLRNWLIRHTDTESCLLSPKELNSMLREFSVVYRPEDLEALQVDLGQGAQMGGAAEKGGRRNTATRFMVDSRSLMRHVLKARGPWVKAFPDLCKKIKKSLAMAQPGAGADEGDNKDKKKRGSGGGAETAAARRLITRLRALSCLDPVDARATRYDGGADGEEKAAVPRQVAPPGFVDRDIFSAIVRQQGVRLTDQEVLMLADASDAHPAADMIRCDVIVEAVSFGLSQGGIARPTDANIFSLEHLRKQLWTTAGRLNRSVVQWQADVDSVFSGFDTGRSSSDPNGGDVSKSGFVTPEDFRLALDLLTANTAADILKDLPSWPKGTGLVNYADILDVVLKPPPRVQAAENAKNKPSAVRAARKKKGGTDDIDLLGDDSDNVEDELAFLDDSGPMATLLRVVRKGLLQYVGVGGALNGAKDALDKAFGRFDTTESGRVSARDFCLAVSVLLDGDDVLLRQAEWQEVVTLLQTGKGGDVYYEKFITKVLDKEGFAQVRVRGGGKAGAGGAADRRSDGAGAEEGLSLGVTGSGVGRKAGSMGGTGGGAVGKVSANLKKRTKALQTLYNKMPAGEKQACSDIVEAIKGACADEMSAGAYGSEVELLSDRLAAEDSNKSNSVAKRSLLATLSNLGVSNTFWNGGTPKGIRKRILDSIEKMSSGDGVACDDFLALLIIRLE
jgi:Ca2+-binding EF-hand superfamily protein